MAQEIKLPQLGQTMEEGTIVNVLIKEGDKINKGDVIFEVETDKATLEMESTAAGFVKQVLVGEGDTIPVGEVVCVVGEENEQVDAPAAKKAEPKSQEVAQAPAAKTEAPATPAKSESLPEGAKIVRLPQLGQTMEEGTIVNVVVKVGDKLAKGDVVLEVETDKATLEMESSVEGVVKAILVEEGETIPVESPVAIVAAEGVEITDAMIAGVKGGDNATAQPKEEPAKQDAAPKPAPTPAPAPAIAPKATPVAAGDRIFATPRAKMIAQELGVDLANVSAKQGAVRIVEADVRAAASAKPASAPATTAAKVAMPAPEYSLGDTVPMTRMQKVVGDRMLQSKQNIPCFYLNTSVDMTELFKFRSEFNKKSSVKVSFNDFIIKAMALGCKQFPIMAGQLDGNNIKIADSVDVGLAISVEDGLVAPICKNADSKSIVEVAASNVAMIDRAKNGKLTPDELSGGCITLSNLGAFGVEWFIPIVVPGQCCIFGTGKIKDTLVPQDGNILVRKMMTMTVSVDHKVANGAYAAQFLDYVKKLLENTSTFV